MIHDHLVNTVFYELNRCLRLVMEWESLMQSIHSSYVPYSECRVGLCTELLFTLFLFKLSDWVEPVKKEFLKKLTYANLKRNLQEQIRYTLRNKNQEDLCEELVLILIDILNEELRDKVGPEDILNASQLEELQYALSEGARRIVKTNRIENGAQRLERRVKRAIEKNPCGSTGWETIRGNAFWML